MECAIVFISVKKFSIQNSVTLILGLMGALDVDSDQYPNLNSVEASLPMIELVRQKHITREAVKISGWSTHLVTGYIPYTRAPPLPEVNS